MRSREGRLRAIVMPGHIMSETAMPGHVVVESPAEGTDPIRAEIHSKDSA